MRHPRLAAALALAAIFSLRPVTSLAQEAEDRLLSAELLEVSTGDLEKAIAAFQALGADEKAPRAVRAKALLGQARCQRKLGRLEAAKRTLDELVAAPEQDPEVLRQAKSYLRELTGNRSENPDFDWIREIEKNPEVQARVFDWAMKLASTQPTEISAAKRQLLALGTIALPVVEKILDASREPMHRQHLAIVAVLAGRIERLAVLLDPAHPAELGMGKIAEGIGDICRLLSSSPDGDRKRALDAIAKVPKSPGTEATRAALEVACGNFENLAQKLSAVLATALRYDVDLARIIDRDAAAADVMATFVLDKSNGLPARLRCLQALDEKAPSKLTREHWLIVEELATQGLLGDGEARNRVRDFVQRLDSKGRHDVLLHLAGGGASEAISTWFVTRYVNTNKLSDAAGGWGNILRRLGERNPADLTRLQQLADFNDEAAVELAALLREQGAIRFDRAPHAADWAPSPKYAELMIGLLDLPWQGVLSFALEALAKAPPKAEPDLLPAVERIAISPRTTEVDVRASAWKVLLRHLAARPDAAPRIAAFFRDAAKHGEFYELGIVAPLEASPVTERMELLRSILGLDLELADAEWLSNIFSTLPPEDAAPLYAGAARLDTPAKRAMLVGVIDLGPLAKSSGGLEFLKGIALDPSLPPEARYSAYAIAGEAGKAWLDWLQLAEADDPILGQMKVSEEWMRQLPRSAQDRFLAALAKSRRPATRAWRLDLYPRERTEYRTVMIEALDDPSEFVQEKAVRSLLDLKEVQPALYARLLEHPIGKQNPKVYEQASLYDDPRILEQLVQLLDDPNPRFRVPALRALKTMRETMETKKEWRAILKAAKEGRKQ